jgi:hypothetical protein
MICKKVGREEWKNLKVGETGVYTLPDENALEAARVAVSHLRKQGYEFERLKVNEPLTIACKRLK